MKFRALLGRCVGRSLELLALHVSQSTWSCELRHFSSSQINGNRSEPPSTPLVVLLRCIRRAQDQRDWPQMTDYSCSVLALEQQYHGRVVHCATGALNTASHDLVQSVPQLKADNLNLPVQRESI